MSKVTGCCHIGSQQRRVPRVVHARKLDNEGNMRWEGTGEAE